MDLGYDMDSGWFLPWGVAGIIGSSDLPNAEYTVELFDAKGRKRHLGTIDGPEHLDLWDTWPDLTVGYAFVSLAEDLVVNWVPASSEETPTFVVVEIAVYDTDIADPNWQTEVARLVVQGDDESGMLVVNASDLAALPLAPNRWDDWGEATGYWGDMTIARHQLRKVRVDGGDMVIDFVHAINGPVFIGQDEPAE